MVCPATAPMSSGCWFCSISASVLKEDDDDELTFLGGGSGMMYKYSSKRHIRQGGPNIRIGFDVVVVVLGRAFPVLINHEKIKMLRSYQSMILDPFKNLVRTIGRALHEDHYTNVRVLGGQGKRWVVQLTIHVILHCVRGFKGFILLNRNGLNTLCRSLRAHHGDSHSPLVTIDNIMSRLTIAVASI
jgi:hypothetical protein